MKASKVERPPAPVLPREVIEKTAAKYREALQRLTGRTGSGRLGGRHLAGGDPEQGGRAQHRAREPSAEEGSPHHVTHDLLPGRCSAARLLAAAAALHEGAGGL